MISKGAKCSISGKQYELKVYNIVKKCKINNNYFNIQNENELSGCKSNNDIECLLDDTIKIPIEIKKIKTGMCIPADQTYQAAPNGLYYLYLHKGTYRIVYRNKEYAVVGYKDIEVNN